MAFLALPKESYQLKFFLIRGGYLFTLGLFLAPSKKRINKRNIVLSRFIDIFETVRLMNYFSYFYFKGNILRFYQRRKSLVAFFYIHYNITSRPQHQEAVLWLDSSHMQISGFTPLLFHRLTPLRLSCYRVYYLYFQS